MAGCSAGREISSVASLAFFEVSHPGARVSGIPIKRIARQTLQFFGVALRTRPQSLPQMLAAQDQLLAGPAQVVLAGERDQEDTRELVCTIHTAYVPNRVVVLVDEQFVRQFSGALPASLDRPDPAAARACRSCGR